MDVVEGVDLRRRMRMGYSRERHSSNVVHVNTSLLEILVT